MLSNKGENIISIHSRGLSNISNNRTDNLNLKNKIDFPENNQTNNYNKGQIVFDTQKPKSNILLKIGIAILLSIAVVIAIVVPIVIVNQKKKDEKKNLDTNIENTIYIEQIKKTKYCIYSLLRLKCINLDNYSDIQSTDISLEFPIEDSTTKKYFCDSIKEKNIIEKKIPPEVIS